MADLDSEFDLSFQTIEPLFPEVHDIWSLADSPHVTSRPLSLTSTDDASTKKKPKASQGRLGLHKKCNERIRQLEKRVDALESVDVDIDGITPEEIQASYKATIDDMQESLVKAQADIQSYKQIISEKDENIDELLKIISSQEKAILTLQASVSQSSHDESLSIPYQVYQIPQDERCEDDSFLPQYSSGLHARGGSQTFFTSKRQPSSAAVIKPSGHIL